MSLRRITALAVLGADACILSQLTPETSLYGVFYMLGALVGVFAAAVLLFDLPLRHPNPSFEDSGFDLSRPVDSVGLLLVLGAVSLIPLLLLVHGVSQGAILQLKGFAYVFFSREPVRFILVCGFYVAWVGIGALLMRKVARASWSRK